MSQQLPPDRWTPPQESVGFAPPQAQPATSGLTWTIVALVAAAVVPALLLGGLALWWFGARDRALDPSTNAPGQELVHVDPGRIDDLRTQRSDRPVTLTFVNRTDAPVFVEWHDEDGAAHQYQRIPPGVSSPQPTYETHPWVVRDENGTALVAVIAGLDRGTVTAD